MLKREDRQNRIKILFVVNNLRRRGAEQQLYNFIKEISIQFDIHVFKFSDDNNEFSELENDKNIKVYSNRFQGTFNIMKTWPLYSCLSKGKFDLVITLGLGTALLLGRICAVICGTQIIYSILNTYENFNRIPKKAGDYFDILNTKLNKLGVFLQMKRILRFLPNSKNLSEKIGLNDFDYQIEILYNGYSEKEFERLLKEKPDENTQQIYNRFKGYPTIVQVGAVDQNKNQKFTLECLKDISKKVPNLRFLIIGEGDFRNKLYKFVVANGFEESVIFSGQKNRADCLYLMSKADVLVLTSKSESFPNVLAEGQAISLPVVTFDVGAASEIVENGNTGFVVPKGNSEQFIQRVIELLQDKRLATQMGRNGRKRIFDHFSMGKKVQKFISMLEHDLKATKNLRLKKA